MDCVLSPHAIIPDISRIKNCSYENSFINHLLCHLKLIKRFELNIKATNNYYFDINYIYSFDKSTQDRFIDIFYTRGLISILTDNIIEESQTPCSISPDLCKTVPSDISTFWLKLLNALSQTNFCIVIGFEEKEVKTLKVNNIDRAAIKSDLDWYSILDEMTYFDKLQLYLAIEIKSKREKISIDKEFVFSEKFIHSISHLNEKTKRNILTTLIDSLHTTQHRAKKLKNANDEYRKDCDDSNRIHYKSENGTIIFLHYGPHNLGLQ